MLETRRILVLNVIRIRFTVIPKGVRQFFQVLAAVSDKIIIHRPFSHT